MLHISQENAKATKDQLTLQEMQLKLQQCEEENCTLRAELREATETIKKHPSTDPPNLIVTGTITGSKRDRGKGDWLGGGARYGGKMTGKFMEHTNPANAGYDTRRTMNSQIHEESAEFSNKPEMNPKASSFAPNYFQQILQ